jgi:hypothetical protein
MYRVNYSTSAYFAVSLSSGLSPRKSYELLYVTCGIHVEILHMEIRSLGQSNPLHIQVTETSRQQNPVITITKNQKEYQCVGSDK